METMDSSTSKKSLLAGGSKRWGATSLFGMALAGLLLAGSHLATAAEVMVFDRGLPTINLNELAGVNRSNLELVDYGPFPLDPTWLPVWMGDDFTLPGCGTYQVTTIRVWSTDSDPDSSTSKYRLSLWGGLAGNPPHPLMQGAGTTPVPYTVKQVTYPGNVGYQDSAVTATMQPAQPQPGGSLGTAFSPIYQIDFSVNIALNAGQTYQFFLVRPLQQTVDPTKVRTGYLHASNAALSGSPQDGADGFMQVLVSDGTVAAWSVMGDRWDKTSDANVQVFATKKPVCPGGNQNGGNGNQNGDDDKHNGDNDKHNGDDDKHNGDNDKHNGDNDKYDNDKHNNSDRWNDHNRGHKH
jgi:hypothetical protein